VLRRLFLTLPGRLTAACLGFVEILIWILVVSEVIQNLETPIYAVSYAGGFALGTYVGIGIEGWLAPGRQVLRIFTRQGKSVAGALRTRGHRLTEFAGQGNDGPVDVLLMEAPRRVMPGTLALVAQLDPLALTVLDDVRVPSLQPVAATGPSFWSQIVKKK